MSTKREPRHPMQPIILMQEGKQTVARFKRNAIVRFLLDAGPFDLNQLALMDFSDEDRAQLAMLIGYSVSGFGDLDYVSRQQVREADAQVEALLS